MQINERSLQEFKALWRESFATEIKNDEAREMASNLLELYALLIKKTPREIEEKKKQK
ncbi:hypothetical protein [Dongia sp.]|uniref:hypothetical protein n=1 Tax=Dongia sp. TaxID=1977262 RepID=UPI0035AEB067